MMVLGLAGGPRRGGNTDTLLNRVLEGAASCGAETDMIILNDMDITPCQHCDACLKKGECRIKDDMQGVYRLLEGADRIALASPVQFLGPTATAKAMIDRCQACWARKYVLKIPPLKDSRSRRGLYVSVGGLKLPRLFEPSLAIVKSWCTVLDIEYAGALTFPGIDAKGEINEHPEALEEAFSAGQGLVG